VDEVAVLDAGERGIACPASSSSASVGSSCDGPAKTEGSEAPLPLPDLCVAALKLCRQRQDTDRKHAGDGWVETGLVFTTWHGTSNELRNFTRSSTGAAAGQRSARSPCTAPRKSCGSLLAALGVHPRVVMHILRYSKFWLDRRG